MKDAEHHHEHHRAIAPSTVTPPEAIDLTVTTEVPTSSLETRIPSSARTTQTDGIRELARESSDPAIASTRAYRGIQPSEAPSIATRMPTAEEEAIQRQQSAEIARSTALVEGYDLVRRLGRGGEGEVWEAVRSSTGQRFALKIFNHGMYQGGSLAFNHQRALAEHLSLHMSGEGSAFSILSEAGVTTDGRPFTVMNLIDSERIWRTAQREIFTAPSDDSEPRLAVSVDRYAAHFEETIRSAWFLSRILDKVHDLGLVHRDIKPDNIAFGEVSGTIHLGLTSDEAPLESGEESEGDDRPDFRRSKLLDTGLMERWKERLPSARRVSKDFREFFEKIPLVSKEDRFVSGTHAYAPPEQYRGECGPWSDQYAFGLSVFEMLTGFNPRKNDGPEKATPMPYLFEALPAEFREKLKDPSFTLLGMPAANVVYIAAEVLRQATEVEYSKRFAKMAEFSNLLSECVTHDPVVHETLPESVRTMIKQCLAA